MTLEKAKELLKIQLQFGNGYNRNATRPILAETQQEHGVTSTNKSIQALHLGTAFGFGLGQTFKY